MDDREALRRVRAWTEQGLADIGCDAGQITLSTLIPIYRMGTREVASWFVGVLREDRIIGFFQLTEEGELMRYSTFQRVAGDLDGCPEAGQWLDNGSVIERASALIGEDERVREAYLTFDSNITRIVWVVEVAGPGGRTRNVFVAGDHVHR